MQLVQSKVFSRQIKNSLSQWDKLGSNKQENKIWDPVHTITRQLVATASLFFENSKDSKTASILAKLQVLDLTTQPNKTKRKRLRLPSIVLSVTCWRKMQVSIGLVRWRISMEKWEGIWIIWAKLRNLAIRTITCMKRSRKSPIGWSRWLGCRR